MPITRTCSRWSGASAVAIGVLTFVYRTWSLQGPPNDHYMHLGWAQELLTGRWPGRDFVEPGMPLTYLLSAAVQAIWPTPFADAMLWVAVLAVATSLVCLVAAKMTSSPLAGIAAGLVTIALQPRLYNAPKLLVPAVGLLLLVRYASAPEPRRLTALGAWTVVSGLLRHDLALVMAVGCCATLVALHGRAPRTLGRALGRYVVVGLVTALPYVVYVQMTDGLLEHLRAGTDLIAVDSHQVRTSLPSIPWLTAGEAWRPIDSATALFVAARMLPLAGLAMLALRRQSLTAQTFAPALAALMMLAAYGAMILRHPVEARLPDAAALLAVVVAVLCVERGSGPRRLAWTVVGGALLMLTLVASAHATGLLDGIDRSRMLSGSREMSRRLDRVIQQGTVWPWPRFWPQGALPPIVEYLAQCTRSSDRVLVTWFGPEYSYYSRRPQAGGLQLFYPGRTFASAQNQEKLIARLQRDRVPIVLFNSGRDPVSYYPIVHAYLERTYRPVGQFTAYDGSTITIAAHRGLLAADTYGPDAWPVPSPRRQGST